MTRIAVDCEFNSFGGQLISMALVSETGNEWYEVLPAPEAVDPWVAENVMPILFKEPVSRNDFRASLANFLAGFYDPVIVADWYTDLMHFFQCFEGDTHEDSLDIPCSAELVTDMEWEKSLTPHNALADARSIMETLRRNGLV